MPFDPFRDKDQLDTFKLAGVVSPGWCEIEGASSPRGWDEQQGFGTDGAYLRWKGDGLPEFTMNVYCWLPEHFVSWASFRSLVKKTPPGVPPKAMSIDYPILDDLEIHSVVVTDESQWEQPDGDGVWKLPIKFKQFRPPKPALAKPAGSIDKPDNHDDANDAVDATTANLTNQLKSLQEQDAKTP